MDYALLMYYTMFEKATLCPNGLIRESTVAAVIFHLLANVSLFTAMCSELYFRKAIYYYYYYYCNFWPNLVIFGGTWWLNC